MEKNIFVKLEDLPVFTIDALKNQFNKNPLPLIKYKLKTGKIMKLKKGFYVSAEFVKKIKYQGRFEAYLEYLATKLLCPSYLSLEYALNKYAILSEMPFALTLVTTKTPRTIQSQLAVLSYTNIKKDLFTGFDYIIIAGFEIKQASKAKALFDFLYLKKRMLKVINKQILESLRLNLGEMQGRDWQEFENYLVLSKSKKMEKIFNILKKL